MPRGLFEEMKVAWGLHSMQPARVLGDNKFMLEFDTKEIKRRNVDGDPWRHRGMPCWLFLTTGFHRRLPLS
jgi:hypothetical protein